VGAKLQHVIATLTAEGAKMSTYGPRIQPRDDLFWFKKPEFLLWLIHFVLFQVHIYVLLYVIWKQLRDEHKLTLCFGLIIVQNAFELASFFWFWVSFLSGLCVSNKSCEHEESLSVHFKSCVVLLPLFFICHILVQK
jgi:mlo protein